MTPTDRSTEDHLLTDLDTYLFHEGTHRRLREKMGSHIVRSDGVQGVQFTVWAPRASQLSVMGDFNGWDPQAHPMNRRGDSGMWELFVPHVGVGAHYKYRVIGPDGTYSADKADPFALFAEVPPERASIVWNLAYDWGDEAWMRGRKAKSALNAPISIYEMHLGSWARKDDGGFLSYREIAPRLAAYVKDMGFTHVELLPLMEHPFYGSWGYQVTGFFAPSSRYGTPQDLMFLIDTLHQQGIGVLLDWVPSHFPTDEHGLSYFDGTHLFEEEDPRRGYHPDWNSYIFHLGRPEVRNFLLASADHWMRAYHADGLRVDAVASMLYLDYSRKQGEWIPNEHGGRENLDAIRFLRDLNTQIYESFPDAQTIAEDSTSWPLVSRPIYLGGLGFGMKWDMGWMHDTLKYMALDPIHRAFSHTHVTFRQMYASSENFVLPLSHDEVVHGKGSLLGKMPGDEWQRFASLRLLFAYQTAQSGKKLLFMGAELAPYSEWNHDRSLEWNLLDFPLHKGVQSVVRDLNRLYRDHPAMHERDCEEGGFEWVDAGDSNNSVLTFLRRGVTTQEVVLVALNFTPIPRYGYQIGVPYGGRWREILNTDAAPYGGSGLGNMGGADTKPLRHHGRSQSISVTLPPLSAVFFLGEEPAPASVKPPPPERPSGPRARPSAADLVPSFPLNSKDVPSKR